MSTPSERALCASPSSSAASTRQEQQQGRSETVHVPTLPSVPSTTSIAASSALTSVGSSSTSSSSVSLPLHSPTSIQQQWPQQHSATVPLPTPSPPSSPTVTPPTMASGPPSLPSSTMTSADVGSSSSSSILALASFPSQPSSLAPSAATPVNALVEPSFKDPALAERYWNYDHQNVSLSDAVAAERALGAAPEFVKRRLRRGEQPPWFWSQNLSTYTTWLKREDIEGEESVCSICMEEFQEHDLCSILLLCFHSFHCFCVAEWWIIGLPEDQRLSCPLCRSIVLDLPSHFDK